MSQKIIVQLAGMTCHSCEVSIEKSWRTLPGIKKVHANFAKNMAMLEVEGDIPSKELLQNALDGTPYHVQSVGVEIKKIVCAVPTTRLSFMEIIGLFALVLVLLGILSKLGWIGGSVSMNGALTFGAVFLIGLVAASSSCIAVTGGLLLSLVASFREKYETLGKKAPFQPVLLFVIGRIIGYTVLGGVLGAIGGELSISPVFTGAITFIAASYMLLTGLNLLHILPNSLKFLLPRLPKFMAHKILDAGGSSKSLAPLILGALTFFLPCGFTQSLQLYALTTGSFTYGALTMLAFSLGTAPALLVLGFATNLGGKVGKFFHSFAGALVVVLGLWNISNAFAIFGYPISFTSAQTSNASQIKTITSESSVQVPIENGEQIVRMVVDGVYRPDHFTIQTGIPVRWEVDGTKAGGCTGVLTSRALGVQEFLKPGINTIKFTPKEPGEIRFACSMGMVRGSFTVIP